jgi:hypothetical protein
MKRIVVVAALLIVGLAVSLYAQVTPDPAKVPRMTIQELKEQMGKPNLVIIDVRSSHDWEESKTKIKGSVREEASKVGAWIAKYPPGKTIVLYCA